MPAPARPGTGPPWQLLKLVPAFDRAQGAGQLHVVGAVQRPPVEKHDAGGALVPACPAFDFDDAAEHATLGIAGSRIGHAGLAEDELAQFGRDRENATVRTDAGRSRRHRGATFDAEERRPLESVISV